MVRTVEVLINLLKSLMFTICHVTTDLRMIRVLGHTHLLSWFRGQTLKVSLLED
jgi:hypothetical protein